jgi:hypothetical protein
MDFLGESKTVTVSNCGGMDIQRANAAENAIRDCHVWTAPFWQGGCADGWLSDA